MILVSTSKRLLSTRIGCCFRSKNLDFSPKPHIPQFKVIRTSPTGRLSTKATLGTALLKLTTNSTLKSKMPKSSNSSWLLRRLVPHFQDTATTIPTQRRTMKWPMPSRDHISTSDMSVPQARSKFLSTPAPGRS